MRTALLTAAALLAALSKLPAGQPPVEESVDLTLVTLNRLVLRPAVNPLPGPLPRKSKDLPASVRPYLRPTHQIDTLSRPVQAAARQVRSAVAPRARDKGRLRDPRALAEGVELWLEAHLGADPSAGPSPSQDQRQAYPPVSALLRSGRADADGRALASVALLRALGVPARVATARGALVAQVWVPLQPPARPVQAVPRGRRSARARTAVAAGWWECADPSLQDAEVDAWSLDPSGLERLSWKPKLELSVQAVGWQRAAFAGSDRAAAQVCYDASLELGSLTATALAQDLSTSVRAQLQSLTTGTATLWLVTAQHWRLLAEGPLLGLDTLKILSPYRPDLASWGREMAGPVRSLDIESEGVWSDRPQRLRLRTDTSLRNDWASPPPALGMLHWFDLGLRRHSTVLQAQRLGIQVQGVVLRCDNLTPRQGWKVTATGEGMTQVAQTIVDADGRFRMAVEGASSARAITVTAVGPDQDSDSQSLPAQP